MISPQFSHFDLNIDICKEYYKNNNIFGIYGYFCEEEAKNTRGIRVCYDDCCFEDDVFYCGSPLEDYNDESYDDLYLIGKDANGAPKDEWFENYQNDFHVFNANSSFQKNVFLYGFIQAELQE